MRLSISSTTLLLILGMNSLAYPVFAQTPRGKSVLDPSPQGPGDLLVAPSRVVLDMHKRTAALNLSNVGSTEATYRISLVRMEMDEFGAMTEVPFEKVPGGVDLPSLIRFSPREVTLAPGEAQTIRLQVRKPAELPVGEYRIHMMFRAIPPAPEPPKESPAAERPKGISVKLIPVYGLALPVIIRNGVTAAKAGLSNLVFHPANRTLNLNLSREGNQSLFGDLKVRWISRKGPTATVAEATGVAVYVPNPTRAMTLNLALPKGATQLATGQLKVTFAIPPTEGGKVLAEALLDLP